MPSGYELGNDERNQANSTSSSGSAVKVHASHLLRNGWSNILTFRDFPCRLALKSDDRPEGVLDTSPGFLGKQRDVYSLGVFSSSTSSEGSEPVG
jgi:hypothetical protein